MKLQNKLAVSYLLVALLPLSLVALLSFTNDREALLNEKKQSLDTIAALKTEAIADYFAVFRHEIMITGDRYVIKANLPMIAQWNENPTKPEFAQAKAVLEEQLRSLAKQLDIDGVILVDTGGMVLYSTNHEYGHQSVDQLFLSAKPFENGAQQVYISDLYIDPKDNTKDFLVSAPVHDAYNVFIGMVVFEVNAHKLYALIQDDTGLGESGETIIARRVANNTKNVSSIYPFNDQGGYVLYLNPLRFDANAAFDRFIKIGSKIGHPTQQAVLGDSGTNIDVDYRGREVLAAWRYLPDYHWGLVVKIDMSEVLMPVAQMTKAIWVFGVVAGLAVLLISWLLARAVSSPINSLTDMAKKIGEGDLDVKINKQAILTGDEVKVLAATLMASARNLKDLYQNLEKKVNTRTKKLEESEMNLKKALAESERANKLMVGRELKMMELKKAITNLTQNSKK